MAITLSVRLEQETIDRIDALAVAMSERAAGATVKRSVAVRVAIERGVEALEREFAATPKPTKKSAR